MVTWSSFERRFLFDADVGVDFLEGVGLDGNLAFLLSEESSLRLM